MDDLTDVTISSPTTAQVLRYNGTTWVNALLALDDLSDVAISSPSTNQVLSYNGSLWVNATFTIAAPNVGSGSFQTGTYIFPGGKVLIDGTDSTIAPGEIGLAENVGNLILSTRGSMTFDIDNDNNSANSVWSFQHHGAGSVVMSLVEDGTLNLLDLFRTDPIGAGFYVRVAGDSGVADRGGLLLNNSINPARHWKQTATFTGAPGTSSRYRAGWVNSGDLETFLNSGPVLEVGPGNTMEINQGGIGNVIIGVDNGGSEKFRVNSNARIGTTNLSVQSSALTIAGTSPSSANQQWIASGRIDLALYDTASTIDSKRWDFSVDGVAGSNSFALLIRNDAGTAGDQILQAFRSGNTITEIRFPGNASTLVRIASQGGTATVGTDPGGSDKLRVGGTLLVQAADDQIATFANTNPSSASAGGNLLLGSNDGGAIATDDKLGGLDFTAHDGTSFGTHSARIEAYASETFTNAAHGTRLRFRTTPVGSTSMAVRQEILADGSVVIGTDPGGTAKLRVGVGNLRVSNTAAVFELLGTTGASQANISGQSGNVRDVSFATNQVARWTMRANSVADSGANAGSNFELIARNDDGSSIDVPLTINRVSSGTIAITSTGSRPVVIGLDMGGTEKFRVGTSSRFGSDAAASMDIYIDRPSGFTGGLNFATTGSNRWGIYANETAETGSNTGSNFRIRARYDNGLFLDDPITIARVASGTIALGGLLGNRPVTIGVDPGGSEILRVGPNSAGGGGDVRISNTTTNVRINSTTGSSTLLMNSPLNNQKDLVFQSNGANRWILRSDNTTESGGNAGSNFLISARDTDGSSIDLPLTIVRAASGTISLGPSGARPVVIGIDPGGSERLRVGGDIRQSGDLLVLNDELQLLRFLPGQLLIRSETSNTVSAIILSPNGTPDPRSRLSLMATDFVADSTNYSRLLLNAPASGDYTISSNIGGTGTYRDIAIIASGTTTNATFKTDGTVAIGTDQNSGYKLHVLGQGYFETASNTTPLTVARFYKTSNFEEFKIGVDDGNTYLHYINDEAQATVRYELEATDTEAGGGAAAINRLMMTMVATLPTSEIRVQSGTFLVVGTDPVGPEILRVGGDVRIHRPGSPGVITFTTDGSGQSHANFGSSGSIDGQSGEFQIKGTSTIPVHIYANGVSRFNVTSTLVTSSLDFKINNLGTFDSTDVPTDLQVLVYHEGSINKWQAESLQFARGQSDFKAALLGDNTAAAYVFLDPGTGGAGSVNTPGTPIINNGHKAITLSIPASYVKTAQFRYFEWQVSKDDGGSPSYSALVNTTSLSLVHSRLTVGSTYRYRVRAVNKDGVNHSAFSSDTGNITAASQSDVQAFAGIIAGEISAVDLTALAGDIGILIAGQFRNSANTFGINFGGVGGIPATWNRGINFENTQIHSGVTRLINFEHLADDSFIEHERFKVTHSGTVFIYANNNSPVFKIATLPSGVAYWQDSTAAPYPITVGMISTFSGYASPFTAVNCIDDDLGTHAFLNSGSVNGAIKIDLGSGNTQEFLRVGFYSEWGTSTTYQTEYSDNDATWTAAGLPFTPITSGWSGSSWSSVGTHRYWRTRITSVGSGTWSNELGYYTSAAGAGIQVQGAPRNWNRYLNLNGTGAFAKHDRLDMNYDGSLIIKSHANNPVFKIASTPAVAYWQDSGAAPFPITAQMISTFSGYASPFTAANCVDDDLTTHAFLNSGSLNGAIRIDLGPGNDQSFVRAGFYSEAATTTTYQTEYSDNDVVWTGAGISFTPITSGWSGATWSPVGAHRYWRTRITLVGSGTWSNELGYYLSSGSAGMQVQGPIRNWTRYFNLNGTGSMVKHEKFEINYDGSMKMKKVRVILTSGTSTTWTVPSDFNPFMNTIELIGGGGGGATGVNNTRAGGGGGGGGYRRIVGFDPGVSTSITYAVGGAGAANSVTAGGTTSWNNGTATATGGVGTNTASGGAGGSGTGGSNGTTGGAGGTGLTAAGATGGGGGGGAAGPSSDGSIGGNGTGSLSGAGGNGGTQNGGAGGAASSGGANAGNNGTIWSSTDGAGGGGSGGFGANAGGAGGQWGAGGGGGGSNVGSSGGGAAGKAGVIVITYFPIGAL